MADTNDSSEKSGDFQQKNGSGEHNRENHSSRRAFGERHAAPGGHGKGGFHSQKPFRAGRSFGKRPLRRSHDGDEAPQDGESQEKSFRPRFPRRNDNHFRSFHDDEGHEGQERHPRRSFHEEEGHSDGEHRPRRSFRPRRDFDDRPRRDFEDRPRRDFDDRPRRDFEDRTRRDFENRPRRDFDDRPHREFEDRPHREFEDRPRRDFEDRPHRDFEDRPHRDFEEKPQEPPLPLPHHHRIAIFGGSFDPIHNGHLQIAEKILENDLADEVLLIPALCSPLKTETLADAKDRLEMVRLAIADYNAAHQPTTAAKVGKEEFHGISYSDIEIQRIGKKSYSYDTMSVLKKVYFDCDLLFVMGLDSLNSLSTWYKAADFVKDNQFIIYPRPDVKQIPYVDLADQFGPRNATKLINAILSEEVVPLSDLASRDLRNALQSEDSEVQKTLGQQLPPSVLNYIREHNLYRN